MYHSVPTSQHACQRPLNNTLCRRSFYLPHHAQPRGGMRIFNRFPAPFVCWWPTPPAAWPASCPASASSARKVKSVWSASRASWLMPRRRFEDVVVMRDGDDGRVYNIYICKIQIYIIYMVYMLYIHMQLQVFFPCHKGCEMRWVSWTHLRKSNVKTKALAPLHF